MDHLLQAFVHHVAVALQREHERVGEHALHAGRDRRRAPVQRLHEIDVHRARERRVAADAGDADRVLDRVELRDRLEELAHRDRLAAARAHVVLLGEQQVGLLRLDQARAGVGAVDVSITVPSGRSVVVIWRVTGCLRLVGLQVVAVDS